MNSWRNEHERCDCEDGSLRDMFAACKDASDELQEAVVCEDVSTCLLRGPH